MSLAVAKREVANMSENWVAICQINDLVPNVGARALLGDQQVALFRVGGDDKVYAIDAIDPFTGAAVLSRGIVGDLKDQIVVASPLYKQHFCLETGRCLENEAVQIKTYQSRVVDGNVELLQSA